MVGINGNYIQSPATIGTYYYIIVCTAVLNQETKMSHFYKSSTDRNFIKWVVYQQAQSS